MVSWESSALHHWFNWREFQWGVRLLIIDLSSTSSRLPIYQYPRTLVIRQLMVCYQTSKKGWAQPYHINWEMSQRILGFLGFGRSWDQGGWICRKATFGTDCLSSCEVTRHGSFRFIYLLVDDIHLIPGGDWIVTMVFLHWRVGLVGKSLTCHNLMQ